MMDTEDFLRERFIALVEQAKEKDQLSNMAYMNLKEKMLLNLDDLDEAYQELIHFVQYHDYYKLLERIEKGEEMVSNETDPVKIRQYKALLAKLYIELEAKRPKGEAS